MFGLFGQQNLGNDCTLKTMLHHARRFFPDSEFLCICTGPEEVMHIHNIAAFDMYAVSDSAKAPGRKSRLGILGKITSRLWKELRHAFMAIRILSRCNLFIFTGGGMLVDNTTGFRGYPFYTFKWVLIAWLCRCKVLFVSVGAGPITHPLSKFFIKKALGLAHYRSYRDTFTRNYLQGIGFNPQADAIYPDLAFSLPYSGPIKDAARPGSKPLVGLGLVDYYGQGGSQQQDPQLIHRDYVRDMCRFVTRLIDRGYPVRLLIGDIEYDNSVKDEVLKILAKKGIAPGRVPIISDPIESVEEMVGQLAHSDIIISPRFHNIILGLLLNKPVISLSYNGKFEAVMAEFGLERYCQSLDGLDIDKLSNQLESIQEEVDLKDKLQRKFESSRGQLYEQYEKIFNRRG